MESEKIGVVLESYPVVGEPDPKAWVFSDAVSLHVCNSRAKFDDDYRPVSHKQHVTLKNGEKVDVVGIGSVTLSFTGAQKVTIPGVVHIPTFVNNFLCSDEFARQGEFGVAFDPEDKDHKAFLYKDNMLAARGFFRGGKIFLNVD